MTDEPTRRVTIVRCIELHRIAHTPGGAAFSEAWRPAPGSVVELSELQAVRLVNAGAADFAKECAPC